MSNVDENLNTKQPEATEVKVVKKGLTLGLGLIIKNLLNYPFDYALYPIVLVWLGSLWGGVVMTILSIFLNIFIIRAYDWSKTDWLLLETLKGLRETDSKSKWQRLMYKILRKGDIFAFFILCFDDPITTTLYLRKGSNKYNGMSVRDWKIFLLATIVSDLYWIVSWSVVIEVVSLIWS